jgi:hypothetical protein
MMEKSRKRIIERDGLFLSLVNLPQPLRDGVGKPMGLIEKPDSQIASLR